MYQSVSYRNFDRGDICISLYLIVRSCRLYFYNAANEQVLNICNVIFETVILVSLSLHFIDSKHKNVDSYVEHTCMHAQVVKACRNSLHICNSFTPREVDWSSIGVQICSLRPTGSLITMCKKYNSVSYCSQAVL